MHEHLIFLALRYVSASVNRSRSTSSCESACQTIDGRGYSYMRGALLWACVHELLAWKWRSILKQASECRMWRESLVMMSEAMVNLLEHGPARYKMDWIYIHTEVRYWSRAELSSLTKNLWSGSFWFWLVWLVLINFLGLIGLDFGRKSQIWRLLGTMAEFLGILLQ